ncbi:MAG: hypothetical protein K2Y05_05565, partial [Hyphomicrobiaceae bacterium]|nr:hypothetical protein [Hyphomicrobiaceae bacterium]
MRRWGWHAALARQLAASGDVHAVSANGPNRPLPRALHWVWALERSGGRRPHPAFRLWDGVVTLAENRPVGTPYHSGALPVGPVTLDGVPSDPVTVDLATASLPSVGPSRTPDRTLVPLYDGVPGEEAMWAALLDGRAPRLSLFDTGTDGAGHFFDIGQPAIEAPQALQMAAGAVVIRLIEGIAHHIAGRLD